MHPEKAMSVALGAVGAVGFVAIAKEGADTFLERLGAVGFAVIFFLAIVAYANSPKK